MQTPIHYLFDGSFDGYLTAVARAVKEEQEVAGISAEGWPRIGSLLSRQRSVVSDSGQAERLFSYLKSEDGLAARYAVAGFFSENQQAPLHLYRLVQLTLQRGLAAAGLHSNDSVRALALLLRQVGGEVHRFQGLIRFRVLADGLHYAPFTPDNNIISQLAGHFRRRLATIPWVLHDLRRDLALYWDTHEIKPITIEPEFSRQVRSSGELPTKYLSANEQEFQQLWRLFHRSISNPARTNPQLQRQLMPRRYWHFLQEMDSLR